MTDGFGSSLVLASLDAEDARRALGDAVVREDVPPRVTDLVRTTNDTRLWATTAVDVADRLDRGDFVVFHRTNGVRAVAQVWGVSVDADEVRRLTHLDDEALVEERWAVVTLTNVQAATDYVALAGVGLREVARPDSLYRVEDVPTLSALREEYTTPMFLVQEMVANPLAFDVPPSGDAGPPERESVTAADSVDRFARIGALGDVVAERYDSREEQARRAAVVLLTGIVGVGALAGAVAAAGVSAALAGTAVVRLGIVLVGGGLALATGALLIVTWAPRPGLARLRATYRAAASVLYGPSGPDSHGGVARRLAQAEDDVAADLERGDTWLGMGVATSLLAVVVGLVYLGYGVGVQLAPALGWLAPVALVGVPWLIIAAFLAPVLAPSIGGLRDRIEELLSRAD